MGNAASVIKARRIRGALRAGISTDCAAGGPIEKVLIANRGEIACRVIRTARCLGLRTVAVYSDADRDALHVRRADEAVYIGPAAAQRSYLCTDSILEAVRKTNADAVHPGYGFLSENSSFAQACADAGIKFIGPSAAAISLMGDKSASKKLMSAANVPVVPGYHGEEQSADLLQSEANRIGYPVLIKPVLGGGGKGMRIVEHESEFLESLKSALRESQAAFGDTRVLVEKYICQPRHIEVQVFGDKFGNHVYLFERDCSVQRRHQKIIEEAPAPHITQEFRRAIGQAAVNAAKAVNYENAGTVEFIVDKKSEEFFFMEMNTRLQVEHPVTEMVTQQDLVEWQIRVASGEKLPCQQEELSVSGHAFEARVYAENVPKGFLPAAGTLHHYTPPLATPAVRVETAVEENDTVSVHYDPMIAKLVVWGNDRNLALTKLSSCLSEFHVGGVPTNIGFLQSLAKHPAFRKGDVDTNFIEHFRDDLFQRSADEEETRRFAALAAVGICLGEKSGGMGIWGRASGFRLNHEYARKLLIQSEDVADRQVFPLEVIYGRERDKFLVKLPGQGEENVFTIACKATVKDMPTRDFAVDMDGVSCNVSFGYHTQAAAHHIHVWRGDKHCHFSTALQQFSSPVVSGDDRQGTSVHVTSTGSTPAGLVPAPMAGLAVKVLVELGKKVKAGDALLVMEAMKMEHTVKAPVSGVVATINVVAGQQVNDAALLFHIEPES